MFIGHFGVALMAKRFAPRASLGALVLGAELADFVLPVLVLLGAEHVRIAPGITRVVPLDLYDYPISHSLVGAAAWALLVALLYLRVARYVRGALVVFVLALSHWLLDVASHRSDVPVLPNGPFVGLGLWNHLAASVVVEAALFGAGVFLYARDTYALDGVGRYGLAVFVGLLAILQGSSYLGPPPPSASAFAFVGLVVVLFVPFAFWVDDHREWANLGPRKS